MKATVHVQVHIDSETLTLSELRPFVGKSVDITVCEVDSTEPATPDIARLRDLARSIDFDEQAFHDLRRISTL